jgi:hypothetical protein
MNNYITSRVIGLDPVTGLNIEARVKEVFINAESRNIRVKVDECLVSPTGKEMKIVQTFYYDRYDTESLPRYSYLEASPIGQGIVQVLNQDLLTHPNYS